MKKCPVPSIHHRVRAFTDAGLALGDISLLSRAEKLLKWMESAFLLPDGSVSSLLYPDQSNSSFGFLEDYTYWIEAILSFGAISEAFNPGQIEGLARKSGNFNASNCWAI